MLHPHRQLVGYAKWAAGSGVVGLITVLLVDEATFCRLVTLIRLIVVLLFVLLLLAVWWANAHGGEQLLIHYFGRAGSAATRHDMWSGQPPVGDVDDEPQVI